MSVTNLVGLVTRGNVQSLCKALAKEQHAKIAYGPDSKLVRGVASALDLLRVVNADHFLAQSAITVQDKIFVPFRFIDRHFEPWQMVAIVAHECIHVQQWRDNPLLFWGRYFTSSSHRAVYEQQAMAAGIEVAYRLTGRFLDIKAYAQGLTVYRCTQRDIQMVIRFLRIIEATLKKGGQVSPLIEMIEKILFKRLTID